MDSPSTTLPCLPLDLDQVIEILPILISISTELDTIPQRYRDLDALFRQQFLNLFTGHESQTPTHERVRASLIHLHDLTQNADLTEGPLHWLELNNDRIGLACDMLALLLSEPAEPEKSDDNKTPPEPRE